MLIFVESVDGAPVHHERNIDAGKTYVETQ